MLTSNIHPVILTQVFGLLVLRAIAPPPTISEELPSLCDDTSRGIAEQLGPASERVQSGPQLTHDATSVQTAQGTNVQSALDGRQSQWLDTEGGMGELRKPPVPQSRLVRLFLSI
ncbi:hypothetical protein MJO28_015768 [Puccinia striiformis f. sp. tritici]|uniref:Uncharacterized protein n=1 Tax=Puccinia striiformis f. sp. tritici TaxID=168172 RepID=A0ACC0DRB2_9BASI|nr:hypothetical protein MJO29_015623 [Puccinia striiformis f. sp. tritici]KAI7936869.1 hypothetical protein MJO28_015768 [Puccinia striiformis f. sp. tritici]